MTTIRKATAKDFDSVYPLFLNFREPRPSRATFQQIFIQHWNSRENFFGYILEDSGQSVGFLGTLFSMREIRGREEKFCNLTCWIVNEGFRTEGLSLLFHVLKLPETTFTDFTGARVAKILTHFGFLPIDKRLFIFLPIPVLCKIFCPCVLTIGNDQIAPYLDNHDRRIFDDHRSFRHQHLLLHDNQQYSFLIGKIAQRKRLPFLEIHYLSQPEFFLRHIRHLLPKICLCMGVVGLMIGDHFMRGRRPTFSLSIPQRLPRLFRSSRVHAEEMDTLYSELQVLDL